MKIQCQVCGNTEKFRRIYDATITEYYDGEGNELEDNAGDVNKIDDDYQEECEECGSCMLDEISEEEEPEEGDYIIQPDGSVTIVGENGLFLSPGARSIEAIMYFMKEKMDREQFWPNVWSLSDHGNLYLYEADDYPKDLARMKRAAEEEA